jgi:SSS family solute:Na+ symporter
MSEIGFTQLVIFVWVFYSAILLTIGMLASRTASFEDYSVGSRSLASVTIGLTLAATFIGPGFSIGLIGRHYISGAAYLFASFGYVFHLLVFGLWVAPWIRQRFPTAISLTDVFVELYGPLTRPIIGALAAVLMVGFSAVMLRAIYSVGEAVFPNYGALTMLLAGSVTAIYATSGGFRATVWTDIFQLVVFLVGFTAVAILVLSVASAGTGETIREPLTLQSLFGGMLGFLLGEMLLPPYVVRIFSARDLRTARDGYLISAALAAMWFLLMALLGSTARGLVASSTSEDQVAYQLFLIAFGSAGLAIASAVLLAVIMSSLSSLLNAGATASVNDLYAALSGANRSRIPRMVPQVATIIIFVAACGLATRFSSILDGLLLVYAVWAPTVVPAFLFGAFGLRSPMFGIAGMGAGFATGLAFELGVVAPPLGLPAILVSLAIASVPLSLGWLREQNKRR